MISTSILFNTYVARLLKVGGCKDADTERVEWRDAEGIDGVRNGDGVSPPQPTRGSGEAS